MMLPVWLRRLFPAAASPAPTYLGRWLTEGKDTVIEISRRGDHYVGQFVAFCPRVACARYPQEQLHFRVLRNLRPEGSHLAGQVLDPTTHHAYRAVLHLAGPHTLALRVQVMGITPYTETWTRQPGTR